MRPRWARTSAWTVSILSLSVAFHEDAVPTAPAPVTSPVRSGEYVPPVPANGWHTFRCQAPLFWAKSPPFGDCDVLVATVEGVNEGAATNARPPTVLLRIDEVLRGFVKRGRVQAVWSERLDLLCAVGEEHTIDAWSAQRVQGPVPRVGERWIVSGGMSRDGEWFDVVPYHRERFTPAARAEAQRRLKDERTDDPDGPSRRRRQHAEDRATLRGYELIAAVKAGDITRIRSLLRSGVRASATDNEGKSAVVWAVETDGLDTARLLLAAGGRADGFSPEPSRDMGGYDGTHLDAALLRAAANGKCEAVDILVKAGARVWARGKGGITALAYAAETGSAQCLRALIAGGAEPNGWDDSGVTPLMRAAYAGRSEVVELLLRHGARSDQRDRSGRTAADFALRGSEIPALQPERRSEYLVLVERLERHSKPNK